MERFLCFIVTVSVLLAAADAAAKPGRWGLAVQPSTGQCTNFFEGDECVKYIPATGWETSFPRRAAGADGYTIRYGGKECPFSQGKEAETCTCLGFSFIMDAGSVKRPTEFTNDPDGPCVQKRQRGY